MATRSGVCESGGFTSSVRLAGTPSSGNYRLQSRTESPRPERLGQEVVGTQLEHPHLVVLVTLCRENDDRNGRRSRPRAEVLEHSIPVHAWQVQVEKDDVGVVAIHLLEGLHP